MRRLLRCSDLGDEVLDQALLGGVVERLLDDAVGGGGRRGGRSRCAARRSSRPAAAAMSASALASQLGDLGLEPGPAVGEQRLGLGVGLGQQPLALALDVAERLADARRLGLGVGLRLGRLVELGLDPLGAGGEGLLGQRPGLPDQQADDDDGGEAAVDELGLLGQQPVVRGVRAAVVDVVLVAIGRRLNIGRTWRRAAFIVATPALIASATAALTTARIGRPAGRQLAGTGGDGAHGVLDVGLGGLAGLLDLRSPRRPASRRCARWPRPAARPARPRACCAPPRCAAAASALIAASWASYVGDLVAGGVGDVLGLLVPAADQRVAGIHPLAQARVEEEAHQQGEHDERPEAPDELLGLGRDRVLVVRRRRALLLLALLGCR